MIIRLVKLALSLAVFVWDRGRDLLRRAAGRPAPPRGVILYYHAVTPGQRDPFARQLDALLRHSRPFRVDHPEDAVRPGNHAAITFDDGYASVVEQALPELRQRNIPCTIFIPTGCLGQPPSWVNSATHAFSKERVITAEQIRELAADPLVSVGSHSVSHPSLLELSAEQAAEELQSSKETLETLVGQEVHLFSFPHGAFNDALVRQARETGYRLVYSIEPSLVPVSPDGHVLGRFAADADDWWVEFRLKLAGAYRWHAWLPRGCRRRHRTAANPRRASTSPSC